MSEEALSRRHSTKKTYSPDSNNDLEEYMDDRTCSMTIDNNNIIMKTPQSLDDLLDVDEHHISTDDEDEDQDENETIDENNDHSKQKKSKQKHGKIE